MIAGGGCPGMRCCGAPTPASERIIAVIAGELGMTCEVSPAAGGAVAASGLIDESEFGAVGPSAVVPPGGGAGVGNIPVNELTACFQAWPDSAFWLRLLALVALFWTFCA